MSKLRTLSKIIFSVTIFASSALADSFIACQDMHGYETNCAITKSVQISPKTPVELKIGTQYKFACIGDEVSLRIKDAATDAVYPLAQSRDWINLQITGYGAFEISDPDPSWTAGAYFQPGCSLEVKITGSDLATAENNRLQDNLKSVTGQSKLVSDLSPLLTNVSLFKTILNQLDIPSIVSLLREKYDTTLTLKNSYDAIPNLDASTALAVVLDDLKLGICLNPPMAEKNSDICGKPAKASADPTDDQKLTLVDKATAALTAIETAVSTIKATAATTVSEPLVAIGQLLGYASATTKKAALDTLCPALKTLGVKNPSCP